MWLAEQAEPVSSFVAPVRPPATEPSDAPTVCVPINVDWVPFVIGALCQLLQPTTWRGDAAAIALAQARATELIDALATAALCVRTESGLVALTIPAGDGTTSAAVSFSLSYSAAPTILLAVDNPLCTASFSDVTTSGFVVHAQIATPDLVDTFVSVSWDTAL